jgi:glutamine synthetase
MTPRPDACTPEALLALVNERQIRFIDLQFTDVAGAVKNVTIPVAELMATINHGIWFDGSSIEGFARIAESDMHLVPDLETFAVLPWLSGPDATARLICNVFTPDGQPFPGDPRAVLGNVLRQAAEMGFDYFAGPELEFFLLHPDPGGNPAPPRPVDGASYFDQPTDAIATGLWREVTETLGGFGIEAEAMHHELAPGQHEMDFRYARALQTADNIVTCRVVLKILAQRKGLYATFMPKPLRGIAGSGLHLHQSLGYRANGSNAFADPGDDHGLSVIAKRFIAGQLLHARGMCAVLAPLVNSYKRLGGYEAPVLVSWGRINRSALVRIPRSHTPSSTRVELRCPDPSCNPYLALAVMLAAGLDGIRRELPVPEPREENLYLKLEAEGRTAKNALPGSLEEALTELEADPVIKGALGPHLCDRFIAAKRLEWEDYRLEVTPWELDKYLGAY